MKYGCVESLNIKFHGVFSEYNIFTDACVSDFVDGNITNKKSLSLICFIDHVYRKVTNSAYRRMCFATWKKKNIYSEVSVLDHEAINQREGTSYKSGSKAASAY